MGSRREQVQRYVAQLDGPSADDAWHALVELGDLALSDIVGAFDVATQPSVRRSLVEVACEYRSPVAAPFLARCLEDADLAIRKAALDGFVTLGGEVALASLALARKSAGPDWRSWIDEAARQIRQGRDS